MTLRPASSLLLAACLTACGVGPRYHRPALDIPAAFTSPNAPGTQAPVDTAWWRSFGAPELTRLIEQAARMSPDVAAAAARIVQADQATRVAGSPLLPTVTGQAGQTWTRTGINSEATGGSALLLGGLNGGHDYTESRLYSGTLNASYEVDFWGKNLDALRAARASALASHYDAQTVWLTTASSVATTYFQAIGYHDRLEIAPA